jgi:hypothetical protein
MATTIGPAAGAFLAATEEAESRPTAGGEPRRDWAVVLYSGECEEHIGLRCAMQAIGPCTLAETNAIVAALPPGMDPHRVSLLAPADFMPDPSAILDRG